jgi:hypothetical protein
MLTFLIKEVVMDRIKDIHDSLVAADSEYHGEEQQSLISLQIFQYQQQIEALKVASHDPSKDYRPDAMVAQNTAQQAESRLNIDFDNLERLINKIPNDAALRKMLEQLRAEVKHANEMVDDARGTKDTDAFKKLVLLKIATVMSLTTEILVVLLADITETSLRWWEQHYERQLKACLLASYVLGFLTLSIKPEFSRHRVAYWQNALSHATQPAKGQHFPSKVNVRSSQIHRLVDQRSDPINN